MIAYVITDPPTYYAIVNSPQCVYIEDVGSMHGTYVVDKRVTARERHRLYDEDLVKFGNEVTRGPGMSSLNHLTTSPFFYSVTSHSGCYMSVTNQSEEQV
jgi:FHA domain